MIGLSEDEQQQFIERMKQKFLSGKSPADGQPVLTILVGAPGSGKSFLAHKINNSVSCSPDDIIAEYLQIMDIDPREDFFDTDLEQFTGKVYDEVVKATIDGKYNFTCDSFKSVDGHEVVTYMSQFGYKADIKVILTDEYQAALNAIKRKLDYDNQYVEYRCNKHLGAKYPQGNPMEVSPSVSIETSDRIAQFVCNAVAEGRQIEIYEFGKTKPSFKTGDDFDKFIESIPLIPISQHIQHCRKLLESARKFGNSKCATDLSVLMQRMQRDPR